MNFQNIIDFLYNFFVDKQFLVLLSSTVILFIAIYIMWYFYHIQLTKRDLFKTPKIDSEHKFATFINRFLYYMQYMVVFPIYSFIWFLIFTLLLVLIAKSSPIPEIMFFGIIIVSVTRIAAYVHPLLAEDMAKLLPWSLIIVFLTDPQSITFESAQISFMNFLAELPKIAKYLFFIAFVEWALRLGFLIINKGKNKEKLKEKN